MLVKNRIYNFQLLKNVLLAKEMDRNQVLVLIGVLIVVEMEELDQIKVFLLFNKHVLSVAVTEK